MGSACKACHNNTEAHEDKPLHLELVHAVHAQHWFVMEKREQTGIISEQGAASTKLWTAAPSLTSTDSQLLVPVAGQGPLQGLCVEDMHSDQLGILLIGLCYLPALRGDDANSG